MFLTTAFVPRNRRLRGEVLHCKAYRRVCFFAIPGGGCIGSGIEEPDRNHEIEAIHAA